MSAALATGPARLLVPRFMQQKAPPLGCVRALGRSAPRGAVGEHEAQLPWSRLSQSISSFAPPAFTGFLANMRRSDFCVGSSRRRCLLRVYRSRGPTQTSLGKNTGCPAAPAPITASASVGFWASRSKARSPGRSGLHQGFTFVRCCGSPRAWRRRKCLSRS